MYLPKDELAIIKAAWWLAAPSSDICTLEKWGLAIIGDKTHQVTIEIKAGKNTQKKFGFQLASPVLALYLAIHGFRLRLI